MSANPNLNLSEYLLLRNNSFVSTTAGTAQAGGNGGNITINTPFIVAVPNENSDIIANAYSGKGGNINIRARSILGIEPRPKPSDATNDITASSELGVQGQISIQQPDVQPTEGLIELPNQVLDASNQIAQDCGRGRNAKPLGEFIVTGRGIPPNSLQPLNGTSSIAPLATLESDLPNTSQATIKAPTPPTAIIEAQGWVKTADGKIVLVALAPQATPSSPPTTSACPNPSQK
ncbi:S-layer family protein [Scytonema hofmannii]|uniref:S-layer family protein n=1 Tax=Scytonema hofmannii TaxID=34078 RepID=UPI001A7EB840|nr:S-layer family protein [Scytonema hofmannii]